jgi:tight adherence protein C
LASVHDSADASWTTDEWVGAKIVLASMLFVVTSAVSIPALGLLACVLSWRVPEIVLARRARRRGVLASSEVPLFLDLLSVCCAAGVAPQLAVRLAVDPVRGPLATELEGALRRTDLGGRWRDEFAASADRLQLAELRRVVAILGGSEALGFSLADEASRLALDAREARRARATERARTAPVKMLFPLVFLILPAFLLLTVVPVLLSTVQSID